MAEFLTDSFTEAVDTTLASHTPEVGGTWVKHVVATADGTVVAAEGRLKGDSTTATSIYYNDAEPGSENYSVQATFRTDRSGASSDFCGVIGRANPAANTFYQTYYQSVGGGSTSDPLFFYKNLNGVGTELGRYLVNLAANTDHDLKLDMNGSALKVLLNGVERFSVSDGGITAKGYAGVRSRANGRVDNLSAVDDTTGGGEQHSGDAEISAVAAIAAAGTKRGIGAAAIDVSAELVASGAKRAGGDAEISAPAAVTSAGVKHASGSATVSAAGAVTAAGSKTAIGQAAIDAGAAADGAGTKTAIGAAEISAVGTITATGGAGVGGSVVISVAAVVTASGSKGAVSSAETAAAAAVIAAGAKTGIGQAAIGAGAEIVCLGTKRAGGAVSIATAAEIIATWSTQRFGSVVISSVAVIVAAGGQVGAGDVGRISLTGRVDGPAELEGRYSPTIRLTGRK